MGDIASGVAGMIDSGPNAPKPKIYSPQYVPEADNTAISGMRSMYNNNPFLQNQPQYASVLSGYMNNPYYGAGIQGASQAGSALTGVGQTALQNANTVGGMVGAPASYMTQILQNAFDPQNALYNRTQQQLSDQVGAYLANSGIGTSGAGAGVMSDAMTNFGIDWQNNLLNREATGINAYNAGVAGMGNAAETASNLGASGAGDIMAGSMMPYNFYTANLGQKQAALDAYGQSTGTQANALTQAAVGDYMSYLQAGIQDQLAKYQAQQQYYQDQMQQYQAQIAGIGSLADTIFGPSGHELLGSMMGGASGTAGGGAMGGSYFGGSGQGGGGGGGGGGSAMMSMIPMLMSMMCDPRVKDVGDEYQDATETLSKLPVRMAKYKWEGDYDLRPMIMADELEKVLPTAVINRNETPGMIRPEDLIPVLIRAVQELSNRVLELETKREE